MGRSGRSGKSQRTTTRLGRPQSRDRVTRESRRRQLLDLPEVVVCPVTGCLVALA